jgi:hypothetical protein
MELIMAQEWIIEFHDPKTKIRKWLVDNISDAVPKNFYTAVDSTGKYVWRLALSQNDHCVLFNRQADAATRMAEAISKNPQLVALEQARRWNGQLPTNMYAGAPLPLLNLQGPAAH